MTIKLTNEMRKRVERDLANEKVEMVKALQKLHRTLEIAETESGWEEFVDEDVKRVQYFENHIARLTAILKKGEIEVTE